MARTAALVGWLVLPWIACACDSSESRATAQESGRVVDAAEVAKPRDRRLLEAARAFELGELERAEQLALALGPESSVDADLLRARVLAERRDDVAAVRTIEALRAAHERDARVFATAAEIHASAGRFESAENEIRAALEANGPSAEISRARGVLAIARPGGAQAGLEHLERARALDPELPFVARPLSQAHRLLGAQAMAKQMPDAAAVHAQAALDELPTDLDAKLLLADALAAARDFDRALAIYEELVERGKDLGSSLAMLYKSAATAALIGRNRQVAVERFARARELGLSNDDLGFGTTVLADECEKAIERGLQAYELGDLDAAETAYRDALRLDPSSIEAMNQLGVVLFGRKDFDGAASLWRSVLDSARARGWKLSEPVHLNLARALYRAGRADEARGLLEGELATGEASPAVLAEAREMLRRLDDPQAAR